MVFRKSKQSDFKLIVDTATRVKCLASKASSTKVIPAYFEESLKKMLIRPLKPLVLPKMEYPH